MKRKIFNTFCLLFICVMSFNLIGCSNNNEEETITYSVGYEFDVYPGYAFYFQLDEDNTIYISNVKIVLTAINEIEEDSVLEESSFFRYEFSISAEGQTSSDLAGNKYWIGFSAGNGIYTASGTVDEEGYISFYKDCYISYLPTSFTFYSVDKS